MNIIKKSYDILRSQHGIALVLNVLQKNEDLYFIKYKNHLLIKTSPDKVIQLANLPIDVWDKINEKDLYLIEFGPLGVATETLIIINEEKF